MKKVISMCLLFVLLLTACGTPNPPIDGTSASTTGENEITTPAENETTTEEEKTPIQIPLSGEVTEEILEQVKKDYYFHRKKTMDGYDPERSVYIDINRTYGIYNGCVPVLLEFEGECYAAACWETEVAGVDFYYLDGRSIDVWKNGSFYSLNGAYEQGFLSKDDLLAIANRQNYGFCQVQYTCDLSAFPTHEESLLYGTIVGTFNGKMLMQVIPDEDCRKYGNLVLINFDQIDALGECNVVVCSYRDVQAPDIENGPLNVIATSVCKKNVPYVIVSCEYVYPEYAQDVALTLAEREEIEAIWNTDRWESDTSEIAPFFLFQAANRQIGYNHVMGIFIDAVAGKHLTLSPDESAVISQMLYHAIVLPDVTVETIEHCTYTPSNFEIELSNEDIAQIVGILNSDGWEKDVTKTAYSYVLEASGNEIRYANSESQAVLNDWSNMRHLVLSEEQTTLINSIFEKYIN